MFGWLVPRSSSPCYRIPRSFVSRCARRIAPRALIEMLPGLGSVLYLHASSDTTKPNALLQGMLVTQRVFAPLLQTHWLVASSSVTDDGPREWCECIDAFGRTLARWHLLPDTDYLAWDAMTSACVANASLSVDTQALRPDCASVVSFQLREFAGLVLLEQEAAPALSPLGDRIATCIANSEFARRFA